MTQLGRFEGEVRSAVNPYKIQRPFQWPRLRGFWYICIQRVPTRGQGELSFCPALLRFLLTENGPQPLLKRLKTARVIVFKPPTMSYNRNPSGRNQHGDKVDKNDPQLAAALRSYHSRLMTSNEEIAKHLEKDHGIILSASSVKRARKHHGLVGGSKNLESMSTQEAEQLVLNQLDLDPTNQAGPRTIRHRIASRSEQHLPREFVAETMRAHRPEGFDRRNPTARKILRHPKVPTGIHERWSCDGHDKLYKIGFPIYGFVDEATGLWLYADIAPSNRQNIIVGYLFLCCIEKWGGIPEQLSTDCGSETTLLHGLQNALREIFHGDVDLRELPAHVYLRSVHNIVIERSWGHLQLDWGKTAVEVFERGQAEGWYDENDENHQELCRWLWAKLLRKVLKRFMEERNSFKSRKDKSKPGPSGMSRETAFKFPERWGGGNRIMPVDINVIREIKQAMGGDQLLDFATPEFSERAEAAYDSLQVQDLTFENVWPVFRELYSLIFV
ncbi:hypothetical protein H0H93_006154 [Arthromyces matolae]|nr:hypothetical protein H0H93_006154 [Arthromyces matolae]